MRVAHSCSCNGDHGDVSLPACTQNTQPWQGESSVRHWKVPGWRSGLETTDQSGETQPKCCTGRQGGHGAREGQEVRMKVRYSAESSSWGEAHADEAPAQRGSFAMAWNVCGPVWQEWWLVPCSSKCVAYAASASSRTWVETENSRLHPRSSETECAFEQDSKLEGWVKEA